MKKNKILSILLLVALTANFGGVSIASELNENAVTSSEDVNTLEDSNNKESSTEPNSETTSEKESNNENLTENSEEIIEEETTTETENGSLYGENVDNSIDQDSDLNAFINSNELSKRISGQGRIETSVAISKFTNTKSEKVIVTDSRNYADALSASSMTFGEYPVLLAGETIKQVVVDEIVRLDAKEVIILGGSGSVSNDVEDILKSITSIDKVTRIAGQNRYETSVLASQKTTNTNLVVSSGKVFADALSASILTTNSADLVLTYPDSVPPSLEDHLSTFSGNNIKLVGGTGTINDKVLNNIKSKANTNNISRLSGGNRYATSAAVASNYTNSDVILIASGETFPDALSAATLSQKLKAPIALVSKNVIDSSVINLIKSGSFKKAIVLGGEGTVSKYTLDNVNRLLKGENVIFNYNPVNYSGYVVSVGAQPYYSNVYYNSKPLGTMKNKQIMKIISQNDFWVKVNYDKKTGYIEKKYVKAYNVRDFGVTANNYNYVSQLSPIYAPNGCEPAALLMALQGKGYTNVNLRTFLDNMPRHSSNPAKGYVGSPYVGLTPGVFQTIDPPALANYANRYGNTVSIQGASVDDIIKEVQNGNNVVIYVTLYWASPYYRTCKVEGKNQSRIWNNHAVLITGYDANQQMFRIADPYNHEKAGGNRSKPFSYWKDRATLERLYNIRKFSIAVR